MQQNVLWLQTLLCWRPQIRWVGVKMYKIQTWDSCIFQRCTQTPPSVFWPTTGSIFNISLVTFVALVPLFWPFKATFSAQFITGVGDWQVLKPTPAFTAAALIAADVLGSCFEQNISDRNFLCSVYHRCVGDWQVLQPTLGTISAKKSSFSLIKKHFLCSVYHRCVRSAGFVTNAGFYCRLAFVWGVFWSQ